MVGIGCRGRAGCLGGSIQYKVQGLHQLLQSCIQVLQRVVCVGIHTPLRCGLHSGFGLLRGHLQAGKARSARQALERVQDALRFGQVTALPGLQRLLRVVGVFHHHALQQTHQRRKVVA